MDGHTFDIKSEQAIRNRIAAWRQAVVDGDLERVVGFYVDDIVAYDAVDALAARGLAAYRKAWEKGFAHLDGGQMVFELGELAVSAAGDLGYAHALIRCGSSADGVEQTGWMRYTGCWRRQGGRWLIAHEHFSVPFSMDGDAKPLFELQP